MGEQCIGLFNEGFKLGLLLGVVITLGVMMFYRKVKP